MAVGSLTWRHQYWDPKIPVEYFGSELLPSQPGSVPKNVFTTHNGGFVTIAPDGEAFVGVRFAQPERLEGAVHYYNGLTFPSYHPYRAKMQWSDDGNDWVDAASADAQDGRLEFDLRDTSARSYWRMLVIESGAAPELVFGRIDFLDATHAWLDLPVDLAWILFAIGILGMITIIKKRLTVRTVYAVAAFAITGLIVSYTYFFAPFWIVTHPDSHTYLLPFIQHTYSPARTAGYPLFLHIVYYMVGLQNTSIVQALVQLAAYFVAAYLIFTTYGVRTLAIPLAVAPFFFQPSLTFASTIMTESLFLASMTLAGAALAAVVRVPRIRYFLLVGVGIAVAALVKSIGVIFVVPAILALRFIPRPRIIQAAALMVSPAILCYLAMSAIHYSKTGRFSAESLGGIALLGHVGAFISGDLPERPGLVAQMREAVEPVLSQRPPELTHVRSKADLDRYVNYTANEYNLLLWSGINRAVGGQFSNMVEMDEVYMRVAILSIKNNPRAYAGHVAAHYYGMWDHGGRFATTWARAGEALRQAAVVNYKDNRDHVNALYRGVLPPYPPAAEVEPTIAKQSMGPLGVGQRNWERFGNLIRHHVRATAVLVIGALSLLLCALWLVPLPIAQVYRSEISLALFINAYFLGHALFQVAIDRYAYVAIPCVFLLMVCGVTTTTQMFRRVMRQMWRPATTASG
jgi:hypothetical protein